MVHGKAISTILIHDHNNPEDTPAYIVNLPKNRPSQTTELTQVTT